MLKILLISLALALAPHSVLASPISDETTERLDSFFQYHLENIQSPGFSVAVVDRDGNSWSRGYGVEVFGGEKAVTPDSIMAIGSLTKSFTAMAILQLEERGLLSVDDLVIDHLPWFRSADNLRREHFALGSETPQGIRPRIISPVAGSTYLLDPELPSQGLRLKLLSNLPTTPRWSCPTLTLEGDAVLLAPGTHTITLHDAETGRSTSREITVEGL